MKGKDLNGNVPILTCKAAVEKKKTKNEVRPVKQVHDAVPQKRMRRVASWGGEGKVISTASLYGTRRCQIVMAS